MWTEFATLVGALAALYLLALPNRIKLIHGSETVRIAVDNSGKMEPLHVRVMRTCPTLSRGIFWPSPLLFNGHFQTAYASLVGRKLRGREIVVYERETLLLKDGGLVAIDWNKGDRRKAEDTPILILLHGLGGGSSDKYILEFIPHADRTGYKCAALNSRGCGGIEVTTPQLYSGSFTQDARDMISHIHARYPEAPMIGIGFSLGANIMLKLVGEDAGACKLTACVSVANPFDLQLGITLLHSTWIGREVYSTALAKSLITFFKKHVRIFAEQTEKPLTYSDPITASEVLKVKYLNEFDDAATRRMFGFRTVNEYYRMASSAQYLPDVSIPTLLLSDMDDPVALSQSIPVADVLANPHVLLATTRVGGHLGWFGWTGKRWFPRPVLEFCKSIVEANHAVKAKHLRIEGKGHLQLQSKKHGRFQNERQRSKSIQVNVGVMTDTAEAPKSSSAKLDLDVNSATELVASSTFKGKGAFWVWFLRYIIQGQALESRASRFALLMISVILGGFSARRRPLVRKKIV
ncbi:Alpha/Beta hydrolase protein [Chytriomyces sp. MP71]|nr:Alpha/Beta hydrolase protein [Chytriomyces sp. MP71]